MKTIKLAAWSCVFLLLCCWSATAAEDLNEADTPWRERSFLVIASTSDYETALKMAESAALKLAIKLDLRGLKPFQNSETKKPDLSFSKEECKENGWDMPCYVPRGRYDTDENVGRFVSIELTNGYKGLAPGYFFVVAGIATPGDLELKDLLAKTKTHFPDAYIKTGQVFVGCLH